MFFIVTPNFNYGRFLGDAIDSVRMQGTKSARHHIQDCESTDSTVEVFGRHRWDGLSLAVENDAGQCDAINKGFLHFEDEQYIGWLNSDEYYLSFAFDRVRRYFETHPDVDVVYGDSIHVNVDGSPVRLVAQHGFNIRVLKSYGTYIQSSSVFFRGSLLTDGRLRLDTEFKQVMDLELYVRLADAGARFAHIPVALSAFRLHPEQVTNRNGKEVADRERERIPGVAVGGLRRTWGRLTHAGLKAGNGATLREKRFQRDYLGTSS